MIAAIHGLMRDAGFFENFAQFRQYPGILAFPERAKRIVVGVTRENRRLAGEGEVRRILYKVGATVGAVRETGAIFGVALRTEHEIAVYNKRGECGRAGGKSEICAVRSWEPRYRTNRDTWGTLRFTRK